MTANALGQTKMGVECLVLCIASVLIERDPSLQERIEAKAQEMYHLLHDRGDLEAAAMIGTFGRALFDPSFGRKK